MTDICLINPRTELPISSRKFNREPPSGILTLCSILREQGFDINFIDLSIEKQARLDFLIEKNPAFIGITSLTNTYPLSLQILKKIRLDRPDIKTIMGGPHVSFRVEQVLSENAIDYVIFGEGEKSLPALMDQVLKNGSISGIRGVAGKENNNIIVNQPAQPINLDELPLPMREILREKYDVADIIVNRGCPYQCSFCVRQKLFQNVRMRKPKNVMDEINQIDQLEYDYFNIYDNINISPQFVKKLCSEMIKNEVDLPWGTELRIDLLDKEIASALRKAGCLAIATGIESGSEVVLSTNNKVQDLSKVKKGIENAKDVHLSIQAYFVIGLPGETRQTFEQTKQFIESLNLEPGIDRINFFIATPYPGSDLFENRGKYGIRIFEGDWEKWDCEHVIFETKSLSREEIEQMVIYGKEIEKHYEKRAS